MPVIAATLILCLAAGVCVVWQRDRGRLARCERDQAALQDRHQAAIRALRLTTNDLRGIALTLQSHAEHVQPELEGSLAGLSRNLLDLTEDMLAQTDDPTAPCHLTEERVPLGELAGFAVAQITSRLGPSRRAWRVAAHLDDIAVLADRRALHQVLLRVLSAATATTRDGDWIDVSADTSSDPWILTIEDEGAGLAVAALEGQGAQSRGVGMGLTLARSLMQAHGGSLTIESAARVGTRVRLCFPLLRLLPALPEHAIG